MRREYEIIQNEVLMAVRGDIRNVAIVAHVDHGKTTLVNAMLKQSNVFSEREEVPDRVLDSNDLEREKGITILAKNTAVQYTGPLAEELGEPEGITINVVDTPGHADFGGEVERGISMVDGVVLLVDASEGPLPQTRFVLRKALEAKLPVILCVNKTDRPDARIEEVVSESTDLLLGLAQDVSEEGIDLDLDALLDLPVIYCAAKVGHASTERPADGEAPDNDDLEPLFDAILKNIPAPKYDEDAPLQAHVTNIDASDYLGRLGLVRIYNGTLVKGKNYGLSRVDGSLENFKLTEVLRTKGLERVPVEEAGPGDIVAIAGVSDIMIGETIVDPNDPKPLPLIHVDEPAISMTFGTNDSPLVGTEGKDHKLTARMLNDRLQRELIGNVSIHVVPTERPDAWEVQGRGELALAILAEEMRREGYELTVGRPQVVTKIIDGKINEPMEATTIDVPDEYMGTVTQLLAERKGRMDSMSNHGSGWVRIEFTVPSRGLIGFRTALLSATRGTGIASSISAGYAPWAGAIVTRQNGSMVADRKGKASPYAMQKLQARGNFFVQPQAPVYEGQVVGVTNKPGDLDINVTLEKHMTNMRSATADVLETLTPPINMSLEESLDFANEDECVEVTPESIRVRKIILDRDQWYKWYSKQRRQNQNS
jgi:GTP-binding protein